MAVKKAKQLSFGKVVLEKNRGHGGKRRGAGRKPASAIRRLRHVRRPQHDARHPVHVTLRFARGLPS